jgi:hypothetical protein
MFCYLFNFVFLFVCLFTFLSVTFELINRKLLIIFVHNPNVLSYVVLSYHVFVTSLHLLFVCLLLCVSVFFPPVLACN